MQKWEYKTVSIEYVHNDYELLVTSVNFKKLQRKERLNAYLTEIGEEGWELVGQSITAPGELVCTFKLPST